MSQAQQLSQLRPLMTRAEIEAFLGPEETKRTLNVLSNSQRNTGVYVHFSQEDGVIDSLTYTAGFNFPRDVAVCGVCIGMTVDAMRNALPDVRLADGQTGEPDERGFIRYRAQPASLNATLGVSVKDGEVYAISLDRLDMDEVLARRKRQKAERSTEWDRQRERANRWKSIQDPDAMLLSWAEHDSPSGESAKSRYVQLARWLMATSDPDVWHILATRWNWDYGHAPLLWIIRQKNCDIATALEIFLLADPAYYFRWGNDRSSVPTDNRDGFDFLTELRQRFAQGFYKRSEIAFDGGQYMRVMSRGLKTAENKALAQSFFPRETGLKIAGRDLTNAADDKFLNCYTMLANFN